MIGYSVLMGLKAEQYTTTVKQHNIKDSCVLDDRSKTGFAQRFFRRILKHKTSILPHVKFCMGLNGDTHNLGTWCTFLRVQ